MKTIQSDKLGDKTEKTNGPLGDYPCRFRSHLESRHYSRSTILQYVGCIRALGELMGERDLRLEDLDEDWAVDLIVAWTGPASAKKEYRPFIVKSFMRFVTGSGTGTPSLSPGESERERLRRDYEKHLRRQRGLSERTIQSCWRVADQFLQFHFGDTVGDLSGIKLTDIARFIQHVTAEGRSPRSKTLSSHLRSFFRYLFQSRKTPGNLALGIPSVAQRYAARVPRHLSPEQVEELVSAVREDNPIGRRNYAMVLLLARLGLRPVEVVAMRIDDIDWRAGEIIVRGKGQLHDRVPLPQDVGEALVEYIRRDRVATSRALFVTRRAPHNPFRDAQILNTVLKDAFRKTGLKPPTRYVGSHILRHSLATTLLQRGASLTEISDMLRHRSRASTLIYAKLDVEGLRSIALPWPVPGGAR
ncbi:MAG: site-specific integrase [Acidobacteriota bacterium]